VEVTCADDESALLAQCRTGDRQAWKWLYERNFAFVVRTARQLGTPAHELDDVAQEVFAVVSRRLTQFESGLITTWMHRICANVVNDHHRRRRVRRALAPFLPWFEEEELRTPERVLMETDARAQVGRILERMSARKREVFVLFELESLSCEQIAERVGCPVETVWSRLFHARKEFARIGNKQRLFEEARGSR
jgi:RNA polymerase sigma-70 factor (ECF subfamily)